MLSLLRAEYPPRPSGAVVSPPKSPINCRPRAVSRRVFTRFISGPSCWFQNRQSQIAENAGVKASSHVNSQNRDGFWLFTPELVGTDERMSELASAIVVRRSALSCFAVRESLGLDPITVLGDRNRSPIRLGDRS